MDVVLRGLFPNQFNFYIVDSKISDFSFFCFFSLKGFPYTLAPFHLFGFPPSEMNGENADLGYWEMHKLCTSLLTSIPETIHNLSLQSLLI